MSLKSGLVLSANHVMFLHIHLGFLFFSLSLSLSPSLSIYLFIFQNHVPFSFRCQRGFNLIPFLLLPEGKR